MTVYMFERQIGSEGAFCLFALSASVFGVSVCVDELKYIKNESQGIKTVVSYVRGD